MPYISIEKVSGKDNASLPVGFWVSGYIHEYPKADPKAEARVVLSSPIESSRGDHYTWFNTSPIVEVVGNVIHTNNSIWKISYFHKK